MFLCPLEKYVTSSPGLQPTPTSINPFDSIKSDDKEEESPLLLDRREEGEEVDEAFLVGELADRLPLLQERSCQGIAIDDQEPHDAFVMSPSRAEEALRTCEFTALALDQYVT